jgi:hypothetical protein
MSRRPPPPLRAHHLVQSSARGPEKAPFGFQEHQHDHEDEDAGTGA